MRALLRRSRSLAVVGGLAAALLSPAAATAAPVAAATAPATARATTAAPATEVLAQIGSTGWRVKAIQRKVGVRATGRYDRATAAAVRAWQTKHDLKGTGRTDRATYRAMFPVTTTYRTGTQVIGYSLLGRPVRLRIVGDPKAATKVLVVGCLHGNECGGVPVVDALSRSAPPEGTAYYLLTFPNPDGRVARTRGNARGVDLNRNFPGWRPNGRPGSVYYPGTKALSEPESRVVHRLMTRVRPQALITYHQALNVVDYGGGPEALQRTYARSVGLRFGRLPRYPGSNATWAHATFPSMTVMTVELPRPVAASALRRHTAAVRALATAL
jgi:murein peptide amidase A